MTETGPKTRGLGVVCDTGSKWDLTQFRVPGRGPLSWALQTLVGDHPFHGTRARSTVVFKHYAPARERGCREDTRSRTPLRHLLQWNNFPAS